MRAHEPREALRREAPEVCGAAVLGAALLLRVGPGDQDGVRVGPMINADAVAKVERHVADALAKGGTLMCGGSRHALGGNFFEPTVVAGCDASMTVANEETFGPLAAVFSFDSEEEVVRNANDTPFGLAAYFYTSDLSRAWRVAEALE